ncbi:MAG: ROK family transcriptional regulator [Microbacterium sp.]
MANRRQLDATAQGRVLSALHRGGPMTRAQATSWAGLARSAAGNAINDLVERGLIRSRDAEPTGIRGRPSAELSVVADAGAALAVKISDHGAEVCVVDLARRVTAHGHAEIRFDRLPPETSLPRLADAIDEFVGDPVERRIRGIGISVPGMVDAEHGVARAVLSLGWRNVPVIDDLLRRMAHPLPIQLGHDAALGAIAEFRLGDHTDARRLLALTSESFGVGAGLVTSSGPTSQLADHALQAGHLIVAPQGPLCSCGSRGCLELFIDGRALRQVLGLSASVEPEHIDARLRALSRVDADRIGLPSLVEHLGTGLTSLVNTLGPDAVILSGLLAPVADLYRDALDEAVGRAVVAQVEPVTLATSRNADAVVIGAAEIALSSFLADPTAATTPR